MSVRAIVIALVLVVLLAPAAFYGELVYGTTYEFASGVPAMAPLFVLFVLGAISTLAGKRRWLGLGRRELLAIYGVVLVSAPLVTHGILGWMLPTGISQQYVARAIPEWETSFLGDMPTWFCPTDSDVVEGYFQGKAAMPWSHWWTPLAAWTSFMLALYLATLFIVVLFQRQWITHERLAFPIAQVPLEMIQDGDGQRGRLAAGWIFWIGFLFSVGLTSVSRLAGIFPAIPDIPLVGAVIMQWQKTGPLAGLGAWELWLSPWMIAVAYLIPKELSFSCWFFWAVRVGLTVAAIAAGATPQRPEEWWDSTFPAPTYQGGGAVLALSAWAIWIGRKHLARAVRLAFSPGAAQGDRGESVLYRWASLGFIVTFGYMIWFCWAAGCRVSVALAMVGLIVVYYVMWARLRAETGLGFIPFPLGVGSMMVLPFGSNALRTREIVTLFNVRWSYFPGFGESFEVCTGNSLETFKIADSGRVEQRPLLYAMMVGFVVSLIVGVYVVMTGMYEIGFFNTRAAVSGWLGGQLKRNGAQIFNQLQNPSDYDPYGLIGAGAGGAFAIFLGVMRLRFWWWPFHPIGYLAANCWGMHWYCQPFFLGWLLKSLTIRYGGLRLFRRTVPLATGIIVGDFVSQGFWVALLTTLRAAGVDI